MPMSYIDKKSGKNNKAFTRSLFFIDLFAGCGGLSLGLAKAGWTGLLAIEKDRFAFETLKANLIDKNTPYAFTWASWFPQEAMSIETFLTIYQKELKKTTFEYDLIAGGPPCQGFSSAGRRRLNDPRNLMIQHYLKLIESSLPKIILLENVHGMTIDFPVGAEGRRTNYSSMLTLKLSDNYHVFSKLINVSEYGVPQSRIRFFVIGLRRDLFDGKVNPFDLLAENKTKFLQRNKLGDLVTSKEAISDLELGKNGSEPSIDSARFFQIKYNTPITSYQQLMHKGCYGVMSDLRLANHRPETVSRFEYIINNSKMNGRLGVSISKEIRNKFSIKKTALRVMDPDAPAPTITSMPDDLLHYNEPRTLTVRENARLQSFPDWYEFKGRYTSGGQRRHSEVPRFTQVANAVPPLMAQALGEVIANLLI